MFQISFDGLLLTLQDRIVDVKLENGPGDPHTTLILSIGKEGMAMPIPSSTPLAPGKYRLTPTSQKVKEVVQKGLSAGRLSVLGKTADFELVVN